MLANPMTPPNDDSAEYRDNLDTTTSPPNLNASLATPASYMDTGLPSSNTGYASPEARLGGETIDHSASDEDMTDGGVALDVGLSDFEEEFGDELQAENTTGSLDGALALFNPLDDHYSVMPDFDFDSFWATPQTLEGPGSPPNPADEMPQASVFPTIEGVTQQLEHLQDTPGHFNLMPAPAEQNFLPNYSNTPFPNHVSTFDSTINPIHSITFNAEEGEYNVDDELNSASNGLVAVTMHHALPPLSLGGLDFNSASQISLPLQEFYDDFASSQDNLESIANSSEVDDRANLGLGDFLHAWAVQSPSYLRDVLQQRKSSRTSSSPVNRSYRAPIVTEIHAQRYPEDLPPVRRCDLQGEKCDAQRLDWQRLGVSRAEAREMRQNTYRNYTNLRAHEWHQPHQDDKGLRLRDNQNFYKFRKMNFDNRVFLSHFQLRNMISCASRNHIFYAGKRKVYQWDPTNASPTPRRVAMNLTSSDVFFDSVQVSTITVGHNILFVGGFCGEYAMVNLRAHKDTKHTEGIATYHDNAITNHVQIHLSRGSYTPRAAISSNDSHLRVLDIATNKIVATHEYEHAINCSALSPDQRLRVLVGDSCEVMICHSDTGEILQSLEGHHDYGFACDWADDGWTVATGNQDGLVKIWDARKWTDSNGKATPVTTIAAELAGVRKLKFSPLGSGKRVLVAAEAADIVNVIDAETFSRKQTLNFFGEVGGFDFTNGGRDLFVAVCDDMRGGIMEFERADFASASTYEITWHADNKSHGRGVRLTGHDWRRTHEDVTYAAGSWGTLQKRRLGGGGPMVESMAYF